MLRVSRSVLVVVRVRVDLPRAVLQPCVSRVGRAVLPVLVAPPPPTYGMLRVLRVARVGRLAVRVARVACRVSEPRVVSCSVCVSRVACGVSCCSIPVIGVLV